MIFILSNLQERVKSVPSSMGASPIAPAVATAVRKGRFSVVTHPDPNLVNLPSAPVSSSTCSPLDVPTQSPQEGWLTPFHSCESFLCY